MKIIDAHMHTLSDPEVNEHVKKYKIDFSEKGLMKECKKNNIQHVLSFACDIKKPTPMGLNIIEKQQQRNKRIEGVAGVNAGFKITQSQINTVEKALKKGLARGIKIYLGYVHHYAAEKVYHPFYKLAQKYKCPIIFHTGDTFGGNALLKYAHPLTVDEVAIKFPKVNFVIAHLGNPWIVDAAEVVYKNSNVYTDLSGFLIGKINKGDDAYVKKQIMYALDYVGDHKKFLYGTDWPLIGMNDYLRVMKKIIPSKIQKDIFYNNAKELFRL